MNDKMILDVAAKALIVNQKGEVLILRESSVHDTNTQVGLYQLPGGRLDKGESFFDALRREVMEEVGLEIEPIRPLYVGEWSPVMKGVTHQIVAIFILCKTKTTKVRLSDEHDAFKWIDPKDHKKYKFADPDWDVIDTYVRSAD